MSLHHHYFIRTSTITSILKSFPFCSKNLQEKRKFLCTFQLELKNCAPDSFNSLKFHYVKKIFCNLLILNLSFFPHISLCTAAHLWFLRFCAYDDAFRCILLVLCHLFICRFALMASKSTFKLAANHN